jgi:hypothetical protein
MLVGQYPLVLADEAVRARSRMSAPVDSEGRVAEIARGLTKAQRRAIMTGQSSGPGCWPMRNALARKGIAQAMPFRLTPLGLAVRNHLNDVHGEKQ